MKKALGRQTRLTPDFLPFHYPHALTDDKLFVPPLDDCVLIVVRSGVVHNAHTLKASPKGQHSKLRRSSRLLCIAHSTRSKSHTTPTSTIVDPGSGGSRMDARPFSETASCSGKCGRWRSRGGQPPHRAAWARSSVGPPNTPTPDIWQLDTVD